MESIAELLTSMIIWNAIILIAIGCAIWVTVNNRLLKYETRIAICISDLKNNQQEALDIILELSDPMPDVCYKDKLSYDVATYILDFPSGTKMSNAMIQRHFAIGPSRASRIINQLVLNKVIKRFENGYFIGIVSYDELNQMEREGKL
jgi:hypothetical protein